MLLPLQVIEPPKQPIIAIVQQIEKPKPVEYIVKQGDNLTRISEAHSVDLSRVWAANSQLTDPDLLEPGMALKIPHKDDVLEPRELPKVVTVEIKNSYSSSAPSPQRNVTVTPKNNYSSGNTYTPGYCTHYAKQRRPDLPNNLGNANTWVARARAQGIPTGSVPRAGAIGQQGNHVVYIEAVNGDGTVLVSEQNYKGLYIVSQRTARAGDFVYIY